jgi:hypothetical protein
MIRFVPGVGTRGAGEGQSGGGAVRLSLALRRPHTFRLARARHDCLAAPRELRLEGGGKALREHIEEAPTIRGRIAYMIFSISALLVATASGCTPIAGADNLWVPNTRWVILGEMHGTNETPDAFIQARVFSCVHW